MWPLSHPANQDIHDRACSRDESGFSIIEVTIVASLIVVISLSLFGLLDSMTKNEGFQQAKIINQEQARFAMTNMSRDIRAANPLEPLPTVAEYANSLVVALGPIDDPQVYVRWRLDGSALKREVLSAPGGTVLSSRTEVDVVENDTEPLFRYFSSDGSELLTSGIGAAAPGDIANCTIRVHIAMTVKSDSRSRKGFTDNSDVELRNHLPGGIGC